MRRSAGIGVERALVADLEQFLAVPQHVAEASRRVTRHPTGWEPGVDTEAGTLVHRSTDPNPPNDWSEILAELRLDPARWEVVSDRVNVRTWDGNVGGGRVVRFYYYKADVRPRMQTDDPDMKALLRQVSRHRFRPANVTQDATSALVVCLADWQAGGSDPQAVGGPGPPYRRPAHRPPQDRET
jgi:hypothetical protein